jgi:hypothetical protein
MPLKTVTSITDEYVATVNAGFARWSHRKGHQFEACGGHFSRIRGGAYKKAERELTKIGFNPAQIKQMLKDADDIAELERNAEE